MLCCVWIEPPSPRRLIGLDDRALEAMLHLHERLGDLQERNHGARAELLGVTSLFVPVLLAVFTLWTTRTTLLLSNWPLPGYRP